MKKRMIPGIVLSVLAVYLAFETFLMYSRITRPRRRLSHRRRQSASACTSSAVCWRLNRPASPIRDAPLYFFVLCAVTALLALAAVLCFWRARRDAARGD